MVQEAETVTQTLNKSKVAQREFLIKESHLVGGVVGLSLAICIQSCGAQVPPAREETGVQITRGDWFRLYGVDAVAEWYRYRIMACLVTSSSPVPLKTRRVGQRCALNLSRAETSSRWCGVVVMRGGASSGVIHVT
ncbi:uncharacterized protein TNCV_2115911 [Trichonephila clavipes]|nr:uncharacterized protein TNCV_2115911 [Trichonephila clavipes]